MTPCSYTYAPVEQIVWGSPARQALIAQLDRLKPDRVFVIASGTLSRKTDVVADLKGALGHRFVGLFDECGEHAPLESVMACVNAVGAARPDLLLTVGGGSVIDTAKIAQLAYTHDVTDLAGLRVHDGVPTTAPSKIRQIVVPTTLSGSEFTNVAGSVDHESQLKIGFMSPDLCARIVILDPNVTLHTPQGLWLSTAIRSIDHAVEGYCGAAGNPFVQATARRAVRLFFESLPRTKRDPNDMAARLISQQAVWLATCGLFQVPMGASHGISYLLGSIGGAPHGHTSCVTLPAVLRWNEVVNGAVQRELADEIDGGESSLSASLRRLLDALGLPQRLGEIGITDAMIPRIVDYALQSPIVATNPRPVKTAADVREILALAS